jgi:hypothetical protein
MNEVTITWDSTCPACVNWQTHKFSFLDTLNTASHKLPKGGYVGPQFLVVGQDGARLLEGHIQFCQQAAQPNGALCPLPADSLPAEVISQLTSSELVPSSRILYQLGKLSRWDVIYSEKARVSEVVLVGEDGITRIDINPPLS